MMQPLTQPVAEPHTRLTNADYLAQTPPANALADTLRRV